MAASYQATHAREVNDIREELAGVVEWVLERLGLATTTEVNIVIKEVMLRRPLAATASVVDVKAHTFVFAMLQQMTKAKNLVLARGMKGRIAYRQHVNTGVAARLDGMVGGDDEEAEGDEDPGAAGKVSIDDGANVWGIQLSPIQQDGKHRTGEVPRADPTPAAANNGIMALYTMVGAL